MPGPVHADKATEAFFLMGEHMKRDTRIVSRSATPNRAYAATLGQSNLKSALSFSALLLAVILLLCAAPAIAAEVRYAPTTGPARNASPVMNRQGEQHPLLQSSTAAADALSSMLFSRLTPGGPILVTSLVDLGDLNKTTDAGRLIPQQIASRLGQYGFTVLDARLGTSMRFEPKTGEFILSRDGARIHTNYAAEAALVGTYSRTGGTMFVSVRVVRLYDSTVLAAYEYNLDISAGSGSLLGHAETWREYALRTQAFPGSTPGEPVWKDPGTAAQLKPLPATQRR